jgi:hypothetical protein
MLNPEADLVTSSSPLVEKSLCKKKPITSNKRQRFVIKDLRQVKSVAARPAYSQRTFSPFFPDEMPNTGSYSEREDEEVFCS